MECVSLAVTEMSEAAADAEDVRLALMRMESISIVSALNDESGRRAFAADPPPARRPESMIHYLFRSADGIPATAWILRTMCLDWSGICRRRQTDRDT